MGQGTIRFTAVNPDPSQLKRCEDFTDRILSEFWNPQTRSFASEPHGDRAAFNWDMGVLLSAVVAATEVDQRKYEPALDKVFNALDAYWIASKGIGAYNSVPFHEGDQADRYYDDNAWIGIALTDAYRITKKPAYLLRAREIERFLESGAASQGGVFWRESTRSERNACSTLPTAALDLRLYLVTHESMYLSRSMALVDWTNRTLVDSSDGLVWDNVKNTGQVDKAKFSYNTAMLIKAEYLLWIATGNHKYWQSAEDRCVKALGHWHRKADDAAFMHLLFESVLMCTREYGDRHWDHIPAVGLMPARDMKAPIGTRVAISALILWQSAFIQSRGADGWFGKTWSAPPEGKSRQLLWQTSMARAMWVAL